MIVFVLGAYVWYFVLTFVDVEWPLVTRRLKFSFAMMSYLLGRYSMFVALLMLFVGYQKGELLSLDCDAKSDQIMTTIAILGNLALVSASTNLLIRAFVLWKHRKYVCAFLVIPCLAHWGYCIQVGVTDFHTSLDPLTQVCTIDFYTARTEFLGFYLYTLFWDILILCFTVVALFKQHDARLARSPLWSALLTQNVGYLFITCITNILMTTMAGLGLNCAW